MPRRVSRFPGTLPAQCPLSGKVGYAPANLRRDTHMRAAVYVRISSDPTGERAGVTRQQTDCLQLCERNGWEVVGVYEDNDQSAFSGKPRPAWDRMWADIEEGEIEGVVAWHPDRMYRRMKELVQVTDRVQKHRLRIATVTAGAVDLSTPEGVLHAQIVGAVAEKESADKSRRSTRWHQQRAEDGHPPGGGTRAFGYDRHREDGRTVWTPNPVEWKTLREIVERVLAGEATVAVCNDLNERGLTTSTGAAWTMRTLKRMLTSPTIAGMRLVDGRLVEGRWEPLVDRVTWERLQAALEQRSSRSGTRAETSGYCLSAGLLRCVCGTRMYGHRKGGRERYECHRAEDGHPPLGCGRVSIGARSIELYVRDALAMTIPWGQVDRHLAQRDSDDTESVRDLERIESQLDGLADDYADGNVSRQAYLRASRRLEERAEAVKKTLLTSANASVVASLPNSEAAFLSKWDDATASWRRRVAELWIESVTVTPAHVRGARFDPNRVSVTWRS